jgi:hypothetical protein
MTNHMTTQPSFLRHIFPRFEDLIFVLVLAAAFALGPRMLGIDSDLGRHLALGNHILDTGSIPDVDILSHTRAGESRPPYEWASQTLFAVAYKLAGLEGVIFLSGLVLAATFWYVYLQADRTANAPFLTLGLTLLAVTATSIHWLPRPHIFSFLLFSIWTANLQRGRSPYFFALLMLLWANVHGGFIFGFLAWLAWFAGHVWDRLVFKVDNNQQIIHLLKIAGLSLVTSMITPDGPGNWQAVLGNHSQYILSNTVETMSPDFYQPQSWPFLLMLALTIATPSLSRASLPAGSIFLVAGMAITGLYMARNIPLFALVSVPYLSEAIHPLVDQFNFWKRLEENLQGLQMQLRGRHWPIAGVITMAVMIVTGSVPGNAGKYQFDPAVFPVDAVDWLDEHPQQGNMFNEFNWGGYLEFRCWPDCRVFLDSQTDFYGEQLLREYQVMVSAGPGWEALIEKYEIAWTITSTRSMLSLKLASSPGWELLYEDPATSIYHKKSSAGN